MQQASIPSITLEITYADGPAETKVLGSGRAIVGRESGDIVLGDAETSALHAEIDWTGGHVIVRDLGSSNGTWRGEQRLPQFALYVGEAFRCGATTIKLLAIEGIGEPPRSGSTAMGKTSEVADPPAASGPTALGMPTPPRPDTPLPPGWQPPAASPAQTHIPGGAPPPATGKPQFAPPPPQHGGTDPVDALGFAPTVASDAPIHPTPPVPAAPPAQPAMPPIQPAAPPIQPAAPPAQPALAMQPPPAAASTVPSGAIPIESAPSAAGGFRAAVPNAVIQPHGAGQPARTIRSPAAPKTGGAGRILAFVGLGGVGVAAVVGVVFLVMSLLSGRSVAFTRDLAKELPQDAVALFAVSSPNAVLELFGDEVPPEVRDAAVEELKFDPFKPDSYASMGFDVDSPLGLSLLEVEDVVVAVSAGVADEDKVRESIKQRFNELAPDTDIPWTTRKFGDVEGLWTAEPEPLVVLFKSDRAILIACAKRCETDKLERYADRVADVEEGSTLADRPGMAGIVAPRGSTLAMVYVDGGSARASIPGGGVEEMAARMAMADIDGFVAALSDDGPRIRLTWETILREGAEGIDLVKGVKRSTKPIDRLGAPVYAELDAAVNAEALDRTFGGAASLGTAALKYLEEGLRGEFAVDLRGDVVQNLSGEIGFALTKLPTSKAGEGPPDEGDRFGGVGFVGLKDADKATSTLERVYGKVHDRLGAKSEQVEGVTVYRVDANPASAAFIHEGYLWLAVGDVDVRDIIKGPDKSFRDEPRHEAISDATKKGAQLAGFVDIKGIHEAVRPLFDERELETQERLKELIDPLEVATFRSETHKRTVVTELILHTSADHALPTLVQEANKVAGKAFAQMLERKLRAEKCTKLAEHLATLVRDELGKASIRSSAAWDVERKVLEECDKPDFSVERVDCYLAAPSFEALAACDKGNDKVGASAAVMADPKPVPYYDDIWPSTKDPGETGKPDPKVNYAVSLGTDPQMRGPENALVTIVEFGDLQCRYCKRAADTLDQVLAAHGDHVRLVFRHNPLPMHTNARIAAKATIAAGRQGKFLAMHDKIFANQDSISQSNLNAWAVELGLDTLKFDRDFFDPAVERQVDEDIAFAKKFGITGTPAFFVNGRYLAGAQSAASFKQLIEEEKARAEKFVQRRGDTVKDLYVDMIGRFASEVVKAPDSARIPSKEAKRFTVDTAGLPRKGASGFARIQMVECGDFDCPYCARFTSKTLQQILDAYPTQVSFFFAHNPLVFHKGAEPAARAAVAADKQGKFWEMHDLLFEDRTTRSDADFVALAKRLRLNVKRFKKDLAAPATAAAVKEQQKLCTDNEATGTPNFFINGRLVAGAKPFADFKVILDEELAGGI